MTFPKFLIAGAINSIISYFIYLGLLLFLPYMVAYTLSYAIGILFGYLLNALWVFRKVPKLVTATTYPLVYLLTYCFGIGLLWLLVEVILVPAEIAPLVVITLTVPIMYFSTKVIFTGND